MLKLATALVAVSLFLSPALAKNTTIKAPKAPVVKCVSPEQVIKGVGEDQLLLRLDGDAVKSFVEGAEEKFETKLPKNADTIVVFKQDEVNVVFALFVGGCFKGAGGLSRKTLSDLTDDGSV